MEIYLILQFFQSFDVMAAKVPHHSLPNFYDAGKSTVIDCTELQWQKNPTGVTFANPTCVPFVHLYVPSTKHRSLGREDHPKWRNHNKK